MLNVIHLTFLSNLLSKEKIGLHSGSASKTRCIFFFAARFDLSDKDKFFDSKTRSTIVSIGFSRWVVGRLLLQEVMDIKSCSCVFLHESNNIGLTPCAPWCVLISNLCDSIRDWKKLIEKTDIFCESALYMCCCIDMHIYTANYAITIMLIQLLSTHACSCISKNESALFCCIIRCMRYWRGQDALEPNTPWVRPISLIQGINKYAMIDYSKTWTGIVKFGMVYWYSSVFHKSIIFFLSLFSEAKLIVYFPLFVLYIFLGKCITWCQFL